MIGAAVLIASLLACGAAFAQFVPGGGGAGGTPGGASGDIQVNSAGAFGGLTPGTGVSTALEAAVGTGGSVLVQDGALGVPASGTLDCSSLTCLNFPGGSAVSVTAATPNIVIDPSPGTGTFTIGTTAAFNTQSGNSAYTILSGDGGKTVNRTNTITQTDPVPQATGSFGSGFGFAYQTGTVGNTLTSTTSTINGVAGATGIKLGPQQGSDFFSDGTDWHAFLGLPQPSTQLGSRVLLSDMTWSTAATDGQLLVGQTSAPVLPKTLSQDCTLAASGAITCTKTNNVSFGALATTTPGSNVAAAAAVNLSAAGGLTTTVVSGTSALGTSAIASGVCASAVTTAATGTATTDVITAGFNGDPTGVTGYAPSASGMLTIISYPSANNVNFKVCNNTASSITPGAITLNWRVVR